MDGCAVCRVSWSRGQVSCGSNTKRQPGAADWTHWSSTYWYGVRPECGVAGGAVLRLSRNRQWWTSGATSRTGLAAPDKSAPFEAAKGHQRGLKRAAKMRQCPVATLTDREEAQRYRGQPGLVKTQDARTCNSHQALSCAGRNGQRAATKPLSVAPTYTRCQEYGAHDRQINPTGEPTGEPTRRRRLGTARSGP